MVGRASSLHFVNYLRDVVCSFPDMEITVFHIAKEKLAEETRAFFRDKNIHCISYYDSLSPFIMKIPKVRALYLRGKIKQTLRAAGKFDICQVHLLDAGVCDAVSASRDLYGKLILNYWGSDLFRAGEYQREMQRRAIRCADYVIMQTEKMKRFFLEKVSPESEAKVRVIKFEVKSLLDVVAACENAPRNERVKWNIACGYNATEAQQHLRVIEQLSALPGELRQRIRLVLLMTYGDPGNGYTDRVVAAAEAAGFETKVYRDFMSQKEMADICAQTDFYINALTSDAFSASMQQFLVAGTVMLCGAWLGYYEIPEAGGSFLTFRDFDELPATFTDAVEHLAEYRKLAERNREILLELSSQERVLAEYKKVFYE